MLGFLCDLSILEHNITSGQSDIFGYNFMNGRLGSRCLAHMLNSFLLWLNALDQEVWCQKRDARVYSKEVVSRACICEA